MYIPTGEAMRKWCLRNPMSLAVLAVCLSLLFLAVSGPLWGDSQQKTGRFYVIGMGPAGPDLATLRALNALKKSDIVLCSDDMQQRFDSHLKGKRVLCDPWEHMFHHHGKTLGELNQTEIEEWRKERIRIREEIVKKIKDEMASGKTVAILDSGDPCTFGPSHWFIEGFEEDQVEIIPGVGCYNAAIATLKKSMIPAYDNRFVMLTWPPFLFGLKGEDGEILDEGVLRDLSKYPTTMVFYMGLGKMDRLVSLLLKYYPPDLPIAVIYYAGYAEKEEVVKGDLTNILEKVKGKKQTWLGLIIVGSCLEGRPYRTCLETIRLGRIKW